MHRNLQLDVGTICPTTLSLVLAAVMWFVPGVADAKNAVDALKNKGFSQEWIDALAKKGEPRWYSGSELKYIGQPVGGLYAGQVYLGGDGRLWYWDIFNQRVLDPGGPGDKFYNAPMVPDDYRNVSSGFILEIGDRAFMMDGRGFEDVRFRSEYPIGRVRLTDRARPVAIELEAFSPFSPTNSNLSSIPATLMSYTLTNTTDQPITMRTGGWLENAGNRQAIRAGVKQPTTTPIDGLMGVVLSAKSNSTLTSNRADLPLQDFEGGYGDWIPRGDAFGKSPFVHAERKGWQTIAGSEGKALANTHNTRVADSSGKADQLTGTLSSPAFKVKRKFLSFFVAGGAFEGTNVAGGEIDGATVVQVLIDDQIVANVTGENNNQHRAANVDLSDYQGKQAMVRIVDSRTGSWGHIQADDFILTDTPRGLSTNSADTGSMGLALLSHEGSIVETGELPESWRAELRRVDDSVPVNAGVIRSKPMILQPDESTEVRFAVAWHFPNGHLGSLFPGELTRRGEQRNYYTKFYEDAGEVITHLGREHDTLAAVTRLWRDTWYDSTLPTWFLDRTFINASTLATTAAFRTHDQDRDDLDGRVYFWEGVYLGPGTCTHVTHYEQAFGRLFPNAARAQREVTDFNAGWDENLGYVRYRAEWGIGHHFGIPHAIDGHAGTILRTYREHTTSTDDAFLGSVWPRVKRAVQFMIDQDAGRGFFADKVPVADRNTEPDGILSGPQYNTLDKVWDGTIPWISGLYMASLRATAEMASDMGDDAFAERCTHLADTGGPKLAKRTFNSNFGYFVQLSDQQGKYVNSNQGVHLDQVFGDAWAGQVGLEEILPAELRRSALSKIFEHSLYRRIGDYRRDAVIPVVRHYADDDEPGLIFCTFPHGGAKRSAPAGGNRWDALVVGYLSECWTGPDYLVAAQMFDLEMPMQALAIARAVHDRYAEAPQRRNPFNEVEYGNHYTRAMSSYGAYIGATGFEYHGPRRHIGFSPKLNAEDFRGAFTAAEGWGTYEQRVSDDSFTCQISLRNGSLRLASFSADLPSLLAGRNVKSVEVQGATPHSVQQDGHKIMVVFGQEIDLLVGDQLTIELIM